MDRLKHKGLPILTMKQFAKFKKLFLSILLILEGENVKN